MPSEKNCLWTSTILPSSPNCPTTISQQQPKPPVTSGWWKMLILHFPAENQQKRMKRNASNLCFSPGVYQNIFIWNMSSSLVLHSNFFPEKSGTLCQDFNLFGNAAFRPKLSADFLLKVLRVIAILKRKITLPLTSTQWAAHGGWR